MRTFHPTTTSASVPSRAYSTHFGGTGQYLETHPWHLNTIILFACSHKLHRAIDLSSSLLVWSVCLDVIFTSPVVDPREGRKVVFLAFCFPTLTWLSSSVYSSLEKDAVDADKVWWQQAWCTWGTILILILSGNIGITNISNTRGADHGQAYGILAPLHNLFPWIPGQSHHWPKPVRKLWTK